MEALLVELISKYPTLAMIFMVVGVLRAIFKPLMTLLHSYVEATPSTKDNEVLAKVKESKVYSAVVWLLDYTASIKLPKKEVKKDA
jgi:hypothetical protein